MRTHELKTWPEPFQAIVDGTKRFEVREDDRGFAVGDALMLREFDPGFSAVVDSFKYTGRTATAKVTYIAHGGRWGLPTRLCVMSITVVATERVPGWRPADWIDPESRAGMLRPEHDPR